MLGPLVAAKLCPPGKQGALTENSTGGLASLHPTVQTSFQPPKSLFSNCPAVDHLPVLSVEPMVGPQSVRPFIVVLTLTGWLGAPVSRTSNRSPT